MLGRLFSVLQFAFQLLYKLLSSQMWILLRAFLSGCTETFRINLLVLNMKFIASYMWLFSFCGLFMSHISQYHWINSAHWPEQRWPWSLHFLYQNWAKPARGGAKVTLWWCHLEPESARRCLGSASSCPCTAPKKGAELRSISWHSDFCS